MCIRSEIWRDIAVLADGIFFAVFSFWFLFLEVL